MTKPIPYVAHAADAAQLHSHFDAVLDGERRTVLLSAPIGGGKRAIVGDLCRHAINKAEDDVLLWRIFVREEDDGMQILLRAYASLFSALSRSQAFRGKVEMALNSQIPNQPKRVQAWYQAFMDGMKKAQKPGEDGQVQVQLPRDNPLVGLVEVAAGIARKFPIILDIQGLQNGHSVGFIAFLESMIRESGDGRLLTLLCVEPIDDTVKNWMALPLQELIDRIGDNLHRIEMAPWGEEEVSEYLASQKLESDAANIARICDGRPGFVAELADWLQAHDKLGDDLSTMTLGDIANVAPDADELTAPDKDTATGERTYATADDAERVAYLAALLGQSFPSGLLADMGGYVRDSVDDLMDATSNLYTEVQYSEQLGTWIYRFDKALHRESVLSRHTDESDQETARRVGAFMERFLAPRGHGYVVKTLRMYAENGAQERAAMLRGMALAGDQPQFWGMTHDLTKYFDEVDWPDAMRRTIYMNLVERMIGAGQVGPAEQIWNDAMAWASDKEDRRMVGWLLFSGSRMDFRRQDLYRARDRATDALKIFTAVDDKLKIAEVNNHLAMVELSDGNPDAALECAKTAEATADVAVVKAHAEYVRGLVAKREAGTRTQAIDHFKKANELAGSVGQAPLALEAGMQLGETLLVTGQTQQAAEILDRVGQIAQALRDPVKERGAAALLGQAHAALKNFDQAVQFGTRALELTRALKFTQLESIDLYNLGFFNLMLGKSKEAVDLFQESRKGADASNPAFQKELLYNLGTALMKEDDLAAAEAVFKEAVNPATQTKDWRKLASTQQQLAGIAGKRGDTSAARAALYKAMEAAEQGGLKDERKAIKRQIQTLGA